MRQPPPPARDQAHIVPPALIPPPTPPRAPSCLQPAPNGREVCVGSYLLQLLPDHGHP